MTISPDEPCACTLDCPTACWQAPPNVSRICCCLLRSRPPLQPSNRTMLEEPKLTIERWVLERRRAEA